MEARREDKPKHGIIAQKTPINPNTIEATLKATVKGHSLGWVGRFCVGAIWAILPLGGEIGSSIDNISRFRIRGLPDER